MNELDRYIGRHDAKIEQLEDDMKAVKSDVHDIKTMLSEAKGGWKVILIIAGIAGTIGGVLVKVVPWLGK